VSLRLAGSPSQVRRSVRDRLAAAGITSADAEATLIVADALGVEPSRLVLAPDPDGAQVERIERCTARRVEREPLQHILGWAGFRRLTLDVGPGVFVPRPETEVLAEVCLAALREGDIAGDLPAELHRPRATAVDLCAGSGAVALALADEFPGLLVYAVEREEAAFEWLTRNIEKHHTWLRGRGAEVIGVNADVRHAPLDSLHGHVDVVASNPPYIPDDCVPRDPEVAQHDPPAALFGGPDGLDTVRDLIVTAARLLRPGGVLAIEHGDEQGVDHQHGGVPGLLRATGWFDNIHDVPDLTGRPRVAVGRRAGAGV
jgi:release factor glutamine methyltransferase